MYNYATQKPSLFTDEGQRMFLRVRDFVVQQLCRGGAVRMHECMEAAGTGDFWDKLACVDWLVELGEIREIPQANCAGQHRVFVKARE